MLVHLYVGSCSSTTAYADHASIQCQVTPPEQQSESHNNYRPGQQNMSSRQTDREAEPMSIDTDATASVGQPGVSEHVLFAPFISDTSNLASI